MSSFARWLAALLLLTPWVSAQVVQTASSGSPQLRFVAQLNVNGCPLIVHDTGASGGPHLAVEPIMCVTERLHNVAARCDPFTQQMYATVPVMLRDDAMLAEVRRQLRHLSPKSVKFATVSNISVSTDASSMFQALGFIWSPEQTIGIVELGCRSSSRNCSVTDLASRIRGSHFEVLDQVRLAAGKISNSTVSSGYYRLTMQNQTLFDAEINFARLDRPPECRQLRFARSIRLINCTARVHQRLDMKGHLLIEPLLCHNISNMINEPIRYDYSRAMYYVKMDVVLQDGMAVEAVRTQLADLSPLSVTFMRLWRAQSHVASGLSRRFEIGPLMVSVDWRSAQLRVYCSTQGDCVVLRSKVMASPFDLWKHVRYSLTSLASDGCILNSDDLRHPWRVEFGSDRVGAPDCSAASDAGALAGRYHPIHGLDCVSESFVRWQWSADLRSCASYCDSDTDCQGFSIQGGEHCKLFVFNVCSNYVRQRECATRSQIYVKQKSGLAPGALCPAGFTHDYRGTKYMHLKDGNTSWTHYKERCRSMPGLVAMADAVTSDISNHLYVVFRAHYEDRSLVPWESSMFLRGLVALDGRQLSKDDEPAGNWFWDTCRIPVDRSLWAPGEPNDGLGGPIEDYIFTHPYGRLVDTPLNGAHAGAFCKCVSPFDAVRCDSGSS